MILDTRTHTHEVASIVSSFNKRPNQVSMTPPIIVVLTTLLLALEAQPNLRPLRHPVELVVCSITETIIIMGVN